VDAAIRRALPAQVDDARAALGLPARILCSQEVAGSYELPKVALVLGACASAG
jgi:hypothetical protein